MELFGVAVAAVGQDCAFAGIVGPARAKILGRVGLGAAFLAVVVEPGGLEGEQVGGLELHPALGQRMLNRLVLADRAAEHDALLGILGCLGECGLADADGLGGDQDALGIEAVQEIAEALAFLADAVFQRNLEPVDEHLVGVDRLAAHLLDLGDFDFRAVEVGVEQRQPVGGVPALVLGRGPRDQQHFVGDLRRGGPGLLAVHDITVAVALGLGLQRRGVEAGVGLGDGEAALHLAGYDVGKNALLLLLGTEHHDRIGPEDIEMDRRGALQRRARFGDRLHHDRGLGDAESGSAVLFRHGDTQPPGIGHGAVEILGEAAVLVLLQPVFAVELGAQLADAVLDGELLFCEGEIHFSGPNGSTPATTS